MSDPARQIDADDPLVGDLLAGTLELIGEAGGWLDPRARLVARAGQLRIESDGEEPRPLVRIPSAAFVRVDDVTWSDDAERLQIVDVPEGFSDIELQLLYVQVALHNQCDRLGWLTRTHPSLAPDLTDGVITTVRRLIPGFRATPVRPADLLFGNRCFRIPLTEGAPAQRLLIPVVDLLNHHRDGARGTWDGRSFHVPLSRPFGTAECALDYGLARDAMETAVVYGFADASADVAHSAPVLVDLPSTGPVHVVGTAREPGGALLPMAAVRGDGSTDLNRMSFRSGEPLAALAETMAATGWDRLTATAVIQAVAQANLILLSDLSGRCAEAGAGSATTTLASAAHHQATIVGAALLP